MKFRPPNSKKVPNLECTRLRLEQENFALYDVIRDSRVIYIALVTQATDPPVKITALQKTCRELDLIYPVTKINHEEDGVQLMTLFYLPFKTLAEHLNETGGQSGFVKVMHGIVTGLINIYDNGYVPLLLSEYGVVVNDHNERGGILLTSLAQTQREDDLCKNDFNTLSVAIFNACKDAPGMHSIDSNLRGLLSCMQLADSKAKRHRLLRAPLFCTHDELVDTFIGDVCDALWTCDEYKREAQRIKVDGFDLHVRSSNYGELQGVLDHGYTGTVKVNNYFDLCVFVRNCRQHMQKHYKSITDNLPEEKKRKNRPLISSLVSYPEKFVKFILRGCPNFFNAIFELSYMVKRRVGGEMRPDGTIAERRLEYIATISYLDKED